MFQSTGPHSNSPGGAHSRVLADLEQIEAPCGEQAIADALARFVMLAKLRIVIVVRFGIELRERGAGVGRKLAQVFADAGELPLAGDVERGVPRLGEALAAARLAQGLGAELVLADGACADARGAGDGEGGDEGALVLGLPPVSAGAAGHGGEVEDVGNAGEGVVAGIALGLAAFADDRDGGDGEFGGGIEIGCFHPPAWSKGIPTLEGVAIGRPAGKVTSPC